MIYTTVVLSTLLVASTALFVQDEQQQKYMWDTYKRDFNKRYETMEEEMSRFSHFMSNMKIIDQRNIAEGLAGGSAVHGINKFSDMSQQEFALRFLRADQSRRSNDTPVATVSTPVRSDLGLVDWAGKYTTPVKDQGYCGSCWAFSATEQIESDAMRLGASFLLSPEQIVQCDPLSSGCNGGWTETAYRYVKSAGGLTLESEYPYTSYQGVTGKCKASGYKAAVTVSGFTTIGSESEMAAYVQTTGPLSVCVDAATWNSYKGGIMNSCGSRVDHCVQAVGVDAAASGGYWKVRNSWGTSWGENGFIRLAYGKDTCAITNDPTYATVAII